MKTNLLWMVAIATMSIVSCKKAADAPTDIEQPSIPVESVAQVVDMNQTFGWNLFGKEVLSKPQKNVLISPYSIQTAMQMATNGAKSNTLEQILATMGCSNCSVSDLNSLHKDLTTLLTNPNDQPTFTVANRYFFDKNRIDVKSTFLDKLNAMYNCGNENLDFNNSNGSKNTINAWVKNNTNQKIDAIVDNVTAEDVAFLINAVHFKGDWATGFTEETTIAANFTTAAGNTVSAQYVNADRNFTFAQTNNFNLVDIPFKDSTFSISLIQPASANTDANWHSTITKTTWKNMYQGMENSRAMVFFPKLDMSYDNDLIGSMRLLGIQDAFSESIAKFQDMGTSPLGNIFINQIKHKAVLKMDEHGAEGAAVTSIGFGVTSVPPTFWFNKPFVLVLRHIPTNTLIFTGYIADPTN